MFIIKLCKSKRDDRSSNEMNFVQPRAIPHTNKLVLTVMLINDLRIFNLTSNKRHKKRTATRILPSQETRKKMLHSYVRHTIAIAMLCKFNFALHGQLKCSLLEKQNVSRYKLMNSSFDPFFFSFSTVLI